MPVPASPLSLKARYVFPVSGPPIAGGTLSLLGPQVVAVGPSGHGAAARDLGNVAILPGLVNAHTHLEFSDCTAPLGQPGNSLPTWIREVVAARRAIAPRVNDSVRQGLRESLTHGTTSLGEIATSDWRAAALPLGSMPRTVMFHEAIGPTRARVAPAHDTVEQFLGKSSAAANVLAAVSPHAPYTVHTELFEQLMALAKRFNRPLAMHLAESPQEIELLASGTGEFRALLERMEAWDDVADARYRSILEYLTRLSDVPRALVVHGNYLAKPEMEFLAQHAATMTVVYCPRTHAYFQHAPYPLAEMLAAGVSVALGTDSRASNPDLSILAEMQFLASRHPAVPPATLLHLATHAGAKALGIGHRVGTLATGMQADLTIVQLPDGPLPKDPHEALLLPTAKVVETWLGGQVAYSATRQP